MNALLLLLLAGIAGPAAHAQMAPERGRLYTAPDASSTGGISGRIVRPAAPIEQILAASTEDPELVYQGEIGGPARDSFQFKGLPVGKYDLIVIYERDFYEGLTLTRDESSLTPDDRKKIEDIIEKSEPFFPKKVVHRAGGETGDGNEARCICTFLRDKTSDAKLAGTGVLACRRTYKLVILKDVGPGWQVVRARDLYPVSLDPKHTLLPQHHFQAELSSIRVADAMKDLGDLDLSH